MNSILARDIEILETAVQMSMGSDVAKRNLNKLLRREIQRDGFQSVYNRLPVEMRYRLAAARVYLGDFSNWTGWIYRSEQAAKWYWLPQPIKRWDGKKTGHLYVVGEQGIGDEILWASCLPDCLELAEQVTYACDKRLMGMLSRSFPQVRFFERLEADPDTHIDAFIPGADLLPLFRHSRADFPQKPILVPDPQAMVDARFVGRTGIGWAGRHGSWDPIKLGIDAPVSLQHSETHPKIEAPPIDLKNDLDAVLALVCVLDHVVCVPSSLHHICGAAGVACDVIWPEKLGVDEEYGKLTGLVSWSHPPGQLPWYPSVNVYKTIRDWRASTAIKRSA